MTLKQLHLTDTGNTTTATPKPAVGVCVCVFGGGSFCKPDFQSLTVTCTKFAYIVMNCPWEVK